MNELHLFAGCGGGVLGGKLLGHRAIGYVEREPYRCRTLQQRIKDRILDDAPIYCGTVREFIDGGYAQEYSGLVDCLCAGFPCPPFSVAGKQLGESDPRNAWPETRDAIRIIKPRFAFLENVSGLMRHKYFIKILQDLRDMGRDARWATIGADASGLPHHRSRLWMVAYTKRGRREQHHAQEWPVYESRALVESENPIQAVDRFLGVGDGVADRLERFRAVTDGQVPAVAATAFRVLTKGLI